MDTTALGVFLQMNCVFRAKVRHSKPNVSIIIKKSQIEKEQYKPAKDNETFFQTSDVLSVAQRKAKGLHILLATEDANTSQVGS